MKQDDVSGMVEALYRDLSRLRQDLLEAEHQRADELAAVPLSWRDSARNLTHYLALRRHDVRALQVDLSALGLSSIGRLEAHVLAGIESVLFALSRISDAPLGPVPPRPPRRTFTEGDTALFRHTEQLLGPPSPERHVRVMVTLPSAAATDYELIRNLVATGMNVARINSAHDDRSAWTAMVSHTRRAERELGRTCRILFDLCGPKLRTGPLETGPAIVHFAPRRDERGTVVRPALVWLGTGPRPEDSEPTSAVVPVDENLAHAFQPGDGIEFVDLPGRKRKMQVVRLGPGGAWAESRQATYLEPSVPLRLVRSGVVIATGEVGAMDPLESSVRLAAGDRLILTASETLGRAGSREPDGRWRDWPRFPCTLDAALTQARPGDPISFDDGKFWGTITATTSEGLEVLIERAPPGGAKLRADKGINLPETALSVPALSDDDLRNLDFASEQVDIIGLSFVREPADLFDLQRNISERTRRQLGVILKIETRTAFENLPRLLFAGLRRPPFGVMVARGDLGVEVGFERLAEVQEEILWLCEAAHVPVVWATQVLEGLAKKGVPSRAEVTDAAMSGRAECVMLNKGPFVLDAVSFLNRVLLRMREHHHKKTPMLRRLKVSEGRYEQPID